MKFLTVKETAKKWGISERRVISLCRSGRINGAYKSGLMWNVPEAAKRPSDMRQNFNKKNIARKTIVIAGLGSEVGICLADLLLKENYYIIGLYQKGTDITKIKPHEKLSLIEVDFKSRESLMNAVGCINTELSGFVFLEIYFNLEDNLDFDYQSFEDSYKVNVFAPNILTRELVKKMNYQSSVVIVTSIEGLRGSFGASAYSSSQAAKVNLVQTFANIYSELYGVRINSLMSGWLSGYGYDETFNKTRNIIPMKRLGFPEEIADDIYLLLTRHKYTTGSSLVSDGGYLAVDEQSKTEDLQAGKFYKYIDRYIAESGTGDSIWAVSTVMPNEWNDDPAEKKFRQDNIDAAVRGVNVSRIYVFDFDDLSVFKEKPYLREYVLNNKVKSMAVDRKLLGKELADKTGNGMLGFNEDKIFIDYYAEEGISRGYISFNKRLIQEKRAAFQELLAIAVPVSKIIK